ncbi:flagellar protein YvyF [Halobacillus litoralis]|uniref:TIGR03826 family flagellar region protein n=1 Tax=Halobacillus litoralis TaxID=45668 RepID=UPI001CD4C23E|nr:TIGR03826 family flagellar region protein [Halobacillus litoralis]MCA0971564.1 flagellar protein YvyF [Halobacillus litoralis]
MAEVANCPRCNAIFMKGPSVYVCPDCKKQEEKDFQTVYAFMRKKQNRTANVQEIEYHTGVEEKLIRKFVAQKRLHPAQFPNLMYSCERCGGDIQDGRLCSSCTEEIHSGLNKMKRNEELEKHKREAERAKNKTYYSLEDD